MNIRITVYNDDEDRIAEVGIDQNSIVEVMPGKAHDFELPDTECVVAFTMREDEPSEDEEEEADEE